MDTAEMSHFCQFTGGGDVLIYGSRHVALISTGALDDDDDDDDDNEMNICAMIENNVREQSNV